MINFKEKADKIKFVLPTGTEPSVAVAQPKAKTAPGAMMQFANDRRGELLKEHEDLKSRVAATTELQDKLRTITTELAQWDGAKPAKLLDPKLITPSAWANRHEASFKSKEYKSLCEEIESAGGNVQPIKVRPIASTEPLKYEVVYGHRRHRACLDLGLPVLALIEDTDDQTLFIEMDRENRQRADLRPYEHGLIYQKALDRGLFPSAKKLADSLSIDLASLGKTLALARLPSDVLQAFISPLDLQYGWAPKLNKALVENPDLVLAEARRIQNESPRPPSKQVLERLLGGCALGNPPSSNSAKIVSITGSGGQSGSISIGATENSLVVNLQNVSQARFNELEKLIQKFLG